MQKEEIRLRANLTALQRIDSNITQIIDSTSHVALYEFTKKAWRSKNIEGTMFLFARSCPPYYGLFVMNRKNTYNCSLPLTELSSIKLNGEYLMYRTESNEINGIWFYEANDRDRFLEQIIKYIREPIPKSHSDTNTSNFLANAQNDLNDMLQRAKRLEQPSSHLLLDASNPTPRSRKHSKHSKPSKSPPISESQSKSNVNSSSSIPSSIEKPSHPTQESKKVFSSDLERLFSNVKSSKPQFQTDLNEAFQPSSSSSSSSSSLPPSTHLTSSTFVPNTSTSSTTSSSSSSSMNGSTSPSFHSSLANHSIPEPSLPPSFDSTSGSDVSFSSSTSTHLHYPSILHHHTYPHPHSHSHSIPPPPPPPPPGLAPSISTLGSSMSSVPPLPPATMYSIPPPLPSTPYQHHPLYIPPGALLAASQPLLAQLPPYLPRDAFRDHLIVLLQTDLPFLEAMYQNYCSLTNAAQCSTLPTLPPLPPSSSSSTDSPSPMSSSRN